MSQNSVRYPEKQIQLAFVEWYTKNFHYIEKVDDVEGFKGSPMDSVGFIADRPVLIEFKHVISTNMVFHADSPASSLELKIVRCLKALYGKEFNCVTEATSTWDRKTVPLIVIVAKSISGGALENLREFARNHATDWQFSLVLYEWDNRIGSKIYESILSDSKFEAKLPDLPNIRAIAPPRAKGLELSDVRKICVEKGIAPIFNAFVSCLLKLGGKVDPGKNQSNLNFKLRNHKTGKTLTVAGIWPFHSDTDKGVLFSFNAENIQLCLGTTKEIFDSLPGVEGPVVGYQNSHKYLRSVDEVSRFWKLLSESM